MSVNEIKENIKKLNLGQISELIEGLKKDLNIQETAVVQPVATAASEKPKEKETGNVSVQ
jgi:ribosomal protein L7/L12